MSRSHRRSLRIAVLVASSFSLLSFLLLHDVYLRERAAVPLIPALVLGSRELVITSGASCVGRIRSSFDFDGRYLLETEGDLRVSIRGERETARFRLTAEFNSLGQLGASEARLRFRESSVLLGSAGVNPIVAVFRSSLSGLQRDFQRSLPGPVHLIEVARGTYRLHYPHLPLDKIRAQPADGGILQTLDLHVHSEDAIECAEDEYLKLDGIIRIIEFLSNRYRFLAEGRVL